MNAHMLPAQPSPASDPSGVAAQPANGLLQQPRNPLHGVTLEAMVRALTEHFGWMNLGQRIPIRCFQIDPNMNSSLKFLRKTPWAREKVESLYLFMLRDQRRKATSNATKTKSLL